MERSPSRRKALGSPTGSGWRGIKSSRDANLSPSTYLNPHSQVQGHGDRLQEMLMPILREDYPELTPGKRRNLRMQTCVCFTNPEADLTEIRKFPSGWKREGLRPWESDFSVLTPEEIPEWVSALRFEVKTVDTPPYFPFRLDPAKQRSLLMRLFDVERWKSIERMLPVNRFGKLQQMRGRPDGGQLFAVGRGDVPWARSAEMHDRRA